MIGKDSFASTSGPALSDYNLLKVIGEGTFAKVLLVNRTSDEKKFAVKMIKKKPHILSKQLEFAANELEVLKESESEFITKLDSYFQTTSHLFFVLEYCSGGELFELLQRKSRFTESEVRFYVSQIALALEALHAKRFMHRDLKPENILLTCDGYVKLADFGLSAKLTSEKLYGFCGTKEYLSPEMLSKEGYNFAADWWALGCLTYELLVGIPAFHSRNSDSAFLFEKIKFGNPAFPPFVSQSARDFIQRLLHKNPTKRLGANGAAEIKNHSWFRDLDWDSILQKKIKPPFVPSILRNTDIHWEDLQSFVDEDECFAAAHLFTGFPVAVRNQKLTAVNDVASVTTIDTLETKSPLSSSFFGETALTVSQNGAVSKGVTRFSHLNNH